MAPKEIFARILLLLAFLPPLLARVGAEEPGNNFNVVESSFRQGDSVEVKSLRRTNESITLLVNYALGSEELAMLYFSIAGNSPTKLALDPRQQAHIKKGQGTVMLHFPHVYPGLPCVTLNQVSTNRVLGHVYFGSPDDVAAARMPGVGLPSSGEGSATPSGIVQVKLVKIILPRVGCENASPAELFEYLSIQSRSHDPTTNDSRLKGLPIMVTSKRKDSLPLSMDLQNIPLGEAIRHAAKMGGFSITYTDTGVVIGDLEGAAAAAQASPARPASPQPVAGAPAAPPSPAAKARQRRDRDHGTMAAQASPSAGAPQPGVGTVTDKASRIIFPFIRAENVIFEEIIEYIRLRSRDLDPDKIGVEIVVKPGASNSDKIGNLDFKDIPLSILLGHVAELYGYNVATEARSYVLTPRS